MSDLADYLQWKRDSAELAALRAEVVQLRADKAAQVKKTRSANSTLRLSNQKLRIANRKLRQEKDELRNKLSAMRQDLSLLPLNKKQQILVHMAMGLRNFEIIDLGFAQTTVEYARRSITGKDV